MPEKAYQLTPKGKLRMLLILHGSDHEAVWSGLERFCRERCEPNAIPALVFHEGGDVIGVQPVEAADEK